MMQEHEEPLPTAWFPSKVDWWLAALLVAAPVIAFASFVALLLSGEGWWGGLLSLVLILVIYLVLVLPMRYGLDEQTLIIRHGLVKQRLPLARIESVRPTRNPLSSPALSLDRLNVRYGAGFFRSVMISPADRDRFLDFLAERAGLQCDEDQLRR